MHNQLSQNNLWSVFNSTSSRLNQKLYTNIRASFNIHHSWFDVLKALYFAPDYKLKMNEIAERAVMSGSGLTRLIDRMIEAGFIVRELSSSDRRVVEAVLTDAGKQKIEEILPKYQEWVQQLFLEHLSQDEAETLASIFENCLTRLNNLDSK